MKKLFSRTLGTTAITLCLASTVYADAADNGTGAEAAAPEGIELEEVVVTATRRAENVQKASRTIEVMSAADLERQGVSDAISFSSAVPSVSITKAGPQLQIYIRGVGNKTATAADDPAIALNLDGVNLPRNYQGGGLFYDLERIEVLKGPQGTLYGRNATGGAINLISAKPSLSGFGGFVEAEVGNYAAAGLTAAVNLPIGDTFALRVSGQTQKHDGYLSDGYDDDKHQSGRLQGLWKPSDRTSLLVSADYAHLGGKGGGIVLYPAVPGTSPWTGMTDPAVKPAESPVLQTLLQDNGYQDAKTWVLSATLVQALTDGIDLTVLPSYIHSTNNTLMLNGGIPIYTDTSDRQYAMEARLSSHGDSDFKWVLGGIYSNEHQSEILQLNQLIQLAGWNNPDFDGKSHALFGEATYSFTDAFRVTGGLRWTSETRNLKGNGFSMLGVPPVGFAPVTMPYQIPAYNPAPPPLVFIPAGPGIFVPSGSFAYDDEKTFVRTTYRAGVEYDLNPTSMLYATVSTGFKSGGFYVAQGPNSYQPETLTAYEIGSKNRFFDDRLQVNVNGFYWQYKDKQETSLGLVPPGVFNTITKNAGEATLYGADLDIQFAVTAKDLISANVTAMDSQYDRFVYDQFSAPPLGTPQTACKTQVTNPTNTQVDCSDQPLTRAPKFKGRLGYQRTQPAGADGSKLVFNADMVASSGYYLSTDYLNGSQAYTDSPPLGNFTTRYPNEWAAGYAMFNASLGYVAPNNLSVTAYVKNIGDKAVYTQAVANTFVLGLVESTIAPPRTYGVRVRYDF
ncbi:MAG: TonB-dependent receptor [Steroidobacteraceae bacterium]